MSQVHGIVRASNGDIKVESTQGKGSTFKIYFPCVKKDSEEHEESVHGQMRGGNERILFVDDEKTLAEMAGNMLEQLGYSVVILSSSTAALQLIKEQPNYFDILITDQTMPDLSGMDLTREVLKLCPGLPVILYTGYSATIDGDEAKRIGINRCLMKPLGMNILADAVRSTLDNTHSNNPR